MELSPSPFLPCAELCDKFDVADSVDAADQRLYSHYNAHVCCRVFIFYRKSQQVTRTISNQQSKVLKRFFFLIFLYACSNLIVVFKEQHAHTQFVFFVLFKTVVVKSQERVEMAKGRNTIYLLPRLACRAFVGACEVS